MKLRTKIISGFIIILIIGLLVGITGLISIQRISDLTQEQDLIRQSYMDAEEVMDAHFEWRQSLTQAVYSGQEFKGSTDPSSCALGKWLTSDSLKTADHEIIHLLGEIKEPHDYVHHAAKEINDLILAGEQDIAINMFENEVLPQTDVTISFIDQIEEKYAFLLTEKTNDILQAQTMANRLIIIFLIVSIAISVLLAYLIIRSIMRPIKEITENAEVLATGSLNIEVNYRVDDEIGRLGKSFINLSHTMKERKRKKEHHIEKIPY